MWTAICQGLQWTAGWRRTLFMKEAEKGNKQKLCGKICLSKADLEEQTEKITYNKWQWNQARSGFFWARETIRPARGALLPGNWFKPDPCDSFSKARPLLGEAIGVGEVLPALGIEQEIKEGKFFNQRGWSLQPICVRADPCISVLHFTRYVFCPRHLTELRLKIWY